MIRTVVVAMKDIVVLEVIRFCIYLLSPEAFEGVMQALFKAWPRTSSMKVVKGKRVME